METENVRPGIRSWVPGLFKWLGRGVLWGTAHWGLFWLDKYIEFVLYPTFLTMFGTTGGIVAMIPLSFLLCWALIALYDSVFNLTKKLELAGKVREGSFWYGVLMTLSDALGFEELKKKGTELRARFYGLVGIRPRKSLIGRALNAVVRAMEVTAQVVMFFFISIFADPMTCLILMRPAGYHKMARREWVIFTTSVVISCTGFGLIVAGIILLVKSSAPWVWDLYSQFLNFVTP